MQQPSPARRLSPWAPPTFGQRLSRYARRALRIVVTVVAGAAPGMPPPPPPPPDPSEQVAEGTPSEKPP